MKDADFSGYATKAGLKCADGRTITPDAFKHQDTLTVPLVWSHVHNDPENILGHAVLEYRDQTHPDGAGIYCWGFFNDTRKGIATKKSVQHKDINSLSIFANNLVEKLVNGTKAVLHGTIREVSLVLAGANPGAKIDYIALAHSDLENDDEILDEEAIIYTGLELELAHSAAPAEEETEEEDEEEEEEETVEHASNEGPTVKEVYDSFTDQQKEVVHFMIGAAVEQVEASDEGGKAKHSATADDSSTDGGDNSEEEESEESSEEGSGGASDSNSETTEEGDLSHQEGSAMTVKQNAFDQDAANGSGIDTSKRLTHDQLVTIMDNAKKMNSFKDAVLAHAEEYGITDINLLFPDAQALTQTPQFIQRRTEWVAKVLGGTKHSPFSKVKTILADITADEARAKGYIKGTRKKEEVFKLLKRTTGPATIYKKQKLDRDDLLDITDMDVINWLKAEMRLMIEEEIARAILIGDGRSSADDDKVKDPEGAVSGEGIRSILHDDDLYSIKVELAANVSPKDAVKGLVRARTKYRGTGKPTLFVSDAYLTDIMLEEDKFGRPLYATEQVLADKLRVESIVTVDLFDDSENLFGIMVSLVDYTIGSNRGGELTNFEDFDIDFNQHKYLQETRLSGGLTKPFSAIVITRGVGTEASVTGPSFDAATDTVTIPNDTGVSYFDTSDDSEMTGNVVITSATEVEARADDGYFIPTGTTRTWTFTP